MDRPRLRTRAAAVLLLLVLAPWTGEYLLGSVPVQQLAALPFLSGLYGGGALLVREVAVRRGLGIGGVLALGLAYGIVEAGLVDQSLFNPAEGLGTAPAPVPALGISAYNALAYLVGHAVWSIGLPIAFTGFLLPATRGKPLTGRPGLVLAAAFYLFGCWIIFADVRAVQGGFMATGPQQAGAALAAAAAALLALSGAADAGRWRLPPPGPPATGILAFLAASAFVLMPETWTGVALKLALISAAVLLGRALANDRRWTCRHGVAAAGGALLTYAWLGFVLSGLLAPGDRVRIAGNAAFAVVAGLLILLARRRVAASEAPPAASPSS